MLHAFQILPLALHTLVALHLRHRLRPFETVAVVLLDEVGEDEGIGTLAAVFRQHADEYQIHGIGGMALHHPQKPKPSPREELAVAVLLQRLGHGWEGYAETDQTVVVVAIYHTGDEVHIRHLDIRIHIPVDLPVGELLEIVEILVGLVDDAEDFPAHAALNQFVLGKLMHVQIVAALDELGCLGKFRRGYLRHLDAVLQPVVVLLEELQSIHVLGIIRVIVVDVHGGFLVESFDEHSFTVHIGKAKWPYQFFHATLSAPVGCGIQQHTGNFQVIDEVEPSEAHLLLVPLVVGTMVDDGGNAAYHLRDAVVDSQEILRFAEIEGWILVFAQCIPLVKTQVRNGIFATFIKVVIELYESSQSFLGSNGYDSNITH